MYKVKKFDSSLERRILTGLIVSDQFMMEASTLLDPRHFQAPALRTAAQWCLDYYGQFGFAPGVHFRDIYESKVASGDVPEEYVEEMEEIFGQLSAEYMAANKDALFNTKYLLQQLERLMRSRSILSLAQDLISLSSSDQVDEAELELARFTPVRREGVLWSDPVGGLSDGQLEEVFNDDRNVLFTMPGALGELMGSVERDSFIGIQAPEKRGKTWFLWEFALRGVQARCNVAFFSVGDMSAVQNWRRVSGRVMRSSKKWGGKLVTVPVADCVLNQMGECPDCREPDQDPVLFSNGKKTPWEDEPTHVVCTYCKNKYPQRYRGAVWYRQMRVAGWSKALAEEALKKFSGRCGGKSVRLQCYPSYQASVQTIRTDLELWEKRDGWLADVVVIDYADILAPENGRESEMRHKINATWGALRGLSTQRSIAVITATQAARSSYNKSQQDLFDTAEDKRKLGHVTSMFALNQTGEQKREKILRVSSLIMREDYFDSQRDVVLLQCLEMSQPLLDCYWRSDGPSGK